MKSDSSPERDHVQDDDITKEPDVADGNKKRKRKPYRPGEEGAGPGIGQSRVLCGHVSMPTSLCVCMCLRYRRVHGASAWRQGRGGSKPHQAVQEGFNGDAAGPG